MDASLWAALYARGPWVAVIGIQFTLLAAVFRAMIKGTLVPRSHVEDVRQDRDVRLREMAAERDDWKHAHQVSEETRSIMARQVEELIPTGKLTNQLLMGLKSSLEGDKT